MSSVFSRKMAVGLWFAAVLSITGCAGSGHRFAGDPMSFSISGNADPVDRTYQARLGALIARDRLDRLDKINGVGPKNPPRGLLNRPLRESRKNLVRHALPISYDPPVLPRMGRHRGNRVFSGNWRTARQTLYIAPSGSDSGAAPFAFSGLQADKVEIAVVATGGQTFRMSLTCDGPMSVAVAGGTVSYRAGERISLLAAGAGDDPGAILRPHKGLDRCDGLANFTMGSRRIAIQREEVADPVLAEFDSRYAVCASPAGSAMSALERAFHTSRWLSQTCPFTTGKPTLLVDEKAGFSAKVEALLGRPLPDRFFNERDPELALDFSHAPRLRLIYLSYLDFKADFSGRIMDRLLRHHAARGTTIRIIASRVLERNKDRAMLESLAADHPNVQVRQFAWKPPRGAPLDEALSRFHKVHHVKMLAAISSGPGNSVAIIGGRNIHDGFLFKQPVDLSRYPHLQQYRTAGGISLNYFASWRDIDLMIRSDHSARILASHLSTIWHEDAVSHVTRPFSIGAKNTEPVKDGVARHFISIPYADGRALEAYYVSLIDAAEHKIEIVNPYLNMTPAIGAAVERALDRGVAITIVGRMDLSGDTGGSAVTALNKLFAARNLDRIAIYDFKVPDVLLHAKILMIDERLVTLSSVNLNNRSFIHDSENGITFLDRRFYRKTKRIFETYRSAAGKISEMDVPLVWRILFRSRTLREAL